MYQRKVDLDMLNAVTSVLADVSSVIPSPSIHISFHLVINIHDLKTSQRSVRPHSI